MGGGLRRNRGQRARPGRVLCAALAVVLALMLWLGAPAYSGTADSANAAAIDPAAAVPPLSVASADDPSAASRPAQALLRAIAEPSPQLADQQFAAIAREYPIIADHVELLRVRRLETEGRLALAEAVSLRALHHYKKSPLRVDFRELLGNARAALGDEKSARSAWKKGLEETRDSDREAVLLLALAQSFERSGGHLAESLETYRSLWIDHAASDQAATATERLAFLERQPNATQRTADDWRRHGDRLFRKRHNEEALAAYDRALAGDLKKSELHRTKNQRAHTLFRMREYPQAVRAFSDLPQKDDVPLWRARSLARAGDVPRAVKEFEKIAKKSRGELGVRATYLAGLLLDGRGKRERAEAHFDRVSRNRVSPGLSRAALWRLGWSAFRAGDDNKALGYLDRLLAQERDPIGRLKTQYWRARTLERMGNPEAETEFASMAQVYPFSYYGWRSRDRISDHSVPATGAGPDSGKDRLGEEELTRARILLSAGLDREAVEDMRRSARRARSLGDRVVLADLFSEAHEYHDSLRLMVDAYTENLARGPVPHFEALWWHAWPAAYGEYVRDSTSAPGSVEPALVLAIMREESSYRPKILSPSGARGLLQIMVPTGERLAERMGQSHFDPDDLFEPETNIRLGAHYLGELQRRFDGRMSASIASYNAGPLAVESWITEADTRDDDEWVESIPYDQTRSYVKRVLRSYHAYRVLY